MFIAPSVTPWRYVISSGPGPAHNPGIRLIKYDRTTGKHLDIKQYYLNLETANMAGFATWQLEYKASDVYKLSDLTPSNLHSLIEKMKDSSSEEFRKLWLHSVVSPPARLLGACDESCHASIICGFTDFYLESFKSCKSARISSAGSVYVSIGLLLGCLLSRFV